LKNADKYKNNVAFQMKGKDGKYRQWSYAEAQSTAAALAGCLQAGGVASGDHVALLSENRPEWPISYLAIVSLGAAVVPLDIMLKREDIQTLLNQCQPKAIITSARARDEIGSELVSLEIKMEEFGALSAGAAPSSYPPVEEDDLAALIYTSGTTGVPKGVMLSHGNIMSNVISLTKHFAQDIKPEDNFLSVLPLNHTFECTGGFLFPFYNGARVTYAESLIPDHILANLRETRASVMLGVPLLYDRFFESVRREAHKKGRIMAAVFRGLMAISRFLPDQSIRRVLFSMVHKKLGGKIKMWLSGAAAIDLRVLEGLGLFGIPVYQGYGMTEASPVITCNSPRQDRIGSVGPALPGVEVRIEAASSEVIVRGPNVMKGYYQRPDLTAGIIRDGWLHTGDVGYLNRDGFLFVTGRMKDVITTSSGMKVYPEDLEIEFNRIDGIKEVCAMGVRTKKGSMGEDVGLVIVPDVQYFEEKGVIDKDMIERIIKKEVSIKNAGLQLHARVARLRFRYQDLPKTTTRKIKRSQLKKEIEEA